MPTPLPETVPEAAASKGRHVPSRDRMPPSSYRYPAFCWVLTVTPPARAMSHSPLSSPWLARWTATREVEHAELTFTLGPVRPSLKETHMGRWSLPVPSITR